MSHRKDCGCSVCRPVPAPELGQVDPHSLPDPERTLGQALDRELLLSPAERLRAAEGAIDGIVGTIQGMTAKTLSLHSRTDELGTRADALDGRLADCDAAITELRGIVRELSRTVQTLVKPPADPPAL